MTTRLRKYKQGAWGNGSTMSRLSIKRHLLIVERVLNGRRYKQAGQAALVSNPDTVNHMFKAGLMLIRRVVNEPWLPVSSRVDLVRRDKEAWLDRVTRARTILLGASK